MINRIKNIHYIYRLFLSLNIAIYSLVIGGNNTPTLAELAGGSNYAWYKIEGCSRNPYAVIPNMLENAHEIETQLRLMFDHGQRRLRIPIFFVHNANILASAGYLSTSPEGLGENDQKKIALLLSIIRSVGFKETIIGFFPMAGSYAENWPSWDQDLYDENFLIIRQVRELAVRSGLHYILDLQNEGAPLSNQSMLIRYESLLWDDYVRRFGVSDTLGFSIVPDQERVLNLSKIFAKHRPSIIDLHIYGDPALTVAKMHAALTLAGLADLPWIIGETYYDNSRELNIIRDAMSKSGSNLAYILQWPTTESSSCGGVNVVPLDNPHSLANPEERP